jgi:hypothetical protein
MRKDHADSKSTEHSTPAKTLTREDIATLSDAEITEWVAEICGWNESDDDLSTKSWRNGEELHHTTCLPQYCFDLNAMHEAEKVLNKDQASTYEFWIHDILSVIVTPHASLRAGDLFLCCHATARQRAEAFLLTMQGQGSAMNGQHAPSVSLSSESESVAL